MTAAHKDTAPMRHRLYQRHTRRNKVTAACPLDLQKFSGKQRRKRDPDERSHNVVAAPALETVFHPALKKHPKQ